LVATLSFARVVETAIRLPVVVVTVLLTCVRVEKDEYVRRLRRGTNATLSLSAKSPVKLFAKDFLI
jgi:hypothetical protein